MCGIVGYIGRGNTKKIILQGLKTLEYRGYDSSGIALISKGNIVVEKKAGRIEKLEESIAGKDYPSDIGIGHTRWATHGVPSDKNSHPHYSMDKSVAVVHNGIIENYQNLRKELVGKGFIFSSDTDTEVISQLIQDMYNGDILDTVEKVIKRLEGSYAIGVIHKNHPNELICAREHSPLVIGIGNGENFIASDVSALLKYTKDVYYLEDGDIATLKIGSVEIFDRDKKTVSREKKHIDWSLEQATKCGYPYFMLKEIFEQPQVIKETFEKRVHNKKIDFSDILTYEEIKNINKIYIVACGTAYHAGLQGQFAFQKIAKLEVFTDVASEFRYSNPFIDEKTMVIFVSQSGETSDTLAALKEAKTKKALTVAITNVVGSTISREAHKVIYTMAGPEIAVASTKAYTTQITIFYLFSLYIGKLKGVISDEKYQEYLSDIENIPEKVQKVINNHEKIKFIAEYLKDKTNGFFIGRGLDYKIALEASLKMKEVSYIHTEAFASGELKHGTIALIESGTPVIVIATQKNLLDKSVSNIKEVKARGAYIITVGFENDENLKEVSDSFISLPLCDDLFSGFLSIIPLQLLAYYTSSLKGIDVDKPRNLAKSVTVE
ncbi:MAG: glutamine--fructose-6-phosphate transaminase (isomerizing) [Fusobacterium sp.]|uniref:glutamine--fructose-6-phosphate transaminase (isomerizing) n=1 Tax=Fusobacterium sp. TaxID=68766 RepID=UPI002A75CDA2|nr:glutamine--fructose-6-phosphate transaminase (isomerizing) [Fusobacterium sp.]MDY2980965.1 glutamine--fructose-6-phosphate transaminase (isomerizing) [Fusobacterium sp.]